MYYPYLRGRQFELIALREYADQYGDINNIIPIVEPVKKTFNSLKIAIPKLIARNVRFAIILNPKVGELPSEAEIQDALKDIINLGNWIPAYIVSNNPLEIAKRIKASNFTEVMLVCHETSDTSSKDFEELVFSPSTKYIVSKENKTLKRALYGKGKEIIRLDDNFTAQKRNKDYLFLPEEKFTEEHMFYKEENYTGFSDYTVVESDYKDGGAPPYAVAIHLTYQKENKEIWIKHFASDTNDGIENIQGKFAEAAKKAIDFFDGRQIHNNALDELRKYYHSQSYPGLGMLKKISIKNHLELVNKILGGS